jgi:hypothetical protein
MHVFLSAVFFTLGLFILVSPVSAKDIYYCAPDETTGFSPTENYKRYNYQNERFNLEVDFENQTIKSSKIGMDGRVACESSVFGETLYCISQYGKSLALNKKTLKFYFSSMFLSQTPKDDIFLAHGSCEKF